MSTNNLSAEEKEDILASEFMDAGEFAEFEKKPRVKAHGYRFASFLFCLCALAGLFVGILGNWFETFTPAQTVAGEGVMNLTMLWVAVQTVIAFFGEAPAINLGVAEGNVLGVVLPYLGLALVGIALLSLILMIVSFAAANPKGAAIANGVITALGYFAVTVIIAVAKLFDGNTATASYDFGLCAVTGVIFLVYVIMGLARRKGYAFLDTVLMILTLGTAWALFLPFTTYGAQMLSVFPYELKEGTDLVLQIAYLTTYLMLLVCFLTAFISMQAKTSVVTNFIFHTLLLAVVVTVYVFIVFQPEVFAISAEAPYWTLFTDYYVIAALAAPFVAFLISLIVLCVKGAKVRKAAKEVEAVEAEEEAPTTAEAEEETEEVPVVSQVVDENATTNATTVANGLPIHIHVYTNGASEKTAETVEEVEEEETPMTEFEQQMSALVANEVKEPVAQAPVVPNYDVKTADQDIFFATLTDAEKNEFCDIFVENKYGKMTYLPTYVIAGDNASFFAKAFIYIDKYRKYTSTNLLDKMYNFINR